MNTTAPVTRSSLLGPIYPDEMVWSYYARFLARFPTINFQKLSVLLGDRLPSYRKAFPTRLGALAAAFNYPGAPDAESLVRDHTFFPIAALENSRSGAERLMRSMIEDSFPAGVDNRLDLPGGFRLRFCPCCAQDDLMKLDGAPYLRRSHQIPEMRICLRHRVALHVTKITAGERTPVRLVEAMEGATALDVCDGQMQAILANAYSAILRETDLPDGDQVAEAFMAFLIERDLTNGRHVGEKLSKMVQLQIGPAACRLMGIDRHYRSAQWWRTIPRLAVVMHLLGIDFQCLLSRALSIPVHVTPPIDTAMQAERVFADKVREHAPAALVALRDNPRRISRWAIATTLSDQLGPGLASNWSHRPLVKAALEEFAETPCRHLGRILALIRSDMAACRTCRTYGELLRRFRVSTALSRVFNEELHQVYREMCGPILV